MQHLAALNGNMVLYSMNMAHERDHAASPVRAGCVVSTACASARPGDNNTTWLEADAPHVDAESDGEHGEDEDDDFMDDRDEEDMSRASDTD